MMSLYHTFLITLAVNVYLYYDSKNNI